MQLLCLLPLLFSHAGPVQVQGEAPRVVLEDAAGETRSRALKGFRTADPRSLGATFVRFEGTSPAGNAPPAGQVCELRLLSGDLLRGRVVAGREERLTLELLGGVRFTVPIDGIESLRFPARIPFAGAGALAPAEEGDRLFRSQGKGLDRVEGTIVSFDAEGVRFEGLVGSKHYPWGEVAALFVDALGGFGDDEEGERPEGVPVSVDLIDRSRLRGYLSLLSQDGARLQAAFEQDVLLPAWTIAEVTIDDGKLQYLSELPVDEAEEGSPFGDDLGMRWSHRADRSVTGEPLRAGGRLHVRGIGVHAPSRLTYELDGEWSALRGLVAIDDQVLRLPSQGSVIFRVHVDGEQRWESPLVRGGDPPLAIPPVDLKGARKLVLEVDMATDFFVADRANWLRMLLVR